MADAADAAEDTEAERRRRWVERWGGDGEGEGEASREMASERRLRCNCGMTEGVLMLDQSADICCRAGSV